MEEIKVGEYVRTKDGEIIKIVDTNMFDKTIYKDIQGAKYYLEDIVKHSPNIIDLIEVGDILEILCNEISKETNTIRIKDIEQLKIIKQIPKFIKSVATKEQFSNIEYRLED